MFFFFCDGSKKHLTPQKTKCLFFSCRCSYLYFLCAKLGRAFLLLCLPCLAQVKAAARLELLKSRLIRISAMAYLRSSMPSCHGHLCSCFADCSADCHGLRTPSPSSPSLFPSSITLNTFSVPHKDKNQDLLL